jgi:hypothetical protein
MVLPKAIAATPTADRNPTFPGESIRRSNSRRSLVGEPATGSVLSTITLAPLAPMASSALGGDGAPAVSSLKLPFICSKLDQLPNRVLTLWYPSKSSQNVCPGCPAHQPAGAASTAATSVGDVTSPASKEVVSAAPPSGLRTPASPAVPSAVAPPSPVVKLSPPQEGALSASAGSAPAQTHAAANLAHPPARRPARSCTRSV